MNQREIKFRAWDPNNKIWLRSTGVNIELDGTIILNDYSQTPTVRMITKDIVLMQFTGFKDKNGNEIYEGDIVEVEDGPNKNTHEVIWHKPTACFALRVSNGSTEYLPNYVRYGQIEVIGNIYENYEAQSKGADY